MLYEIKGVDVYDVIQQNSSEFDLSEYPAEHPLYSNANKKTMGKMKDELNSIPLEEFAGCAPKCYSLLYTGSVDGNKIIDEDTHEKATAKGTKSGVKDRFLIHNEYCRVIHEGCSLSVKQNMIRSINYQLGTFHQTRTALTPCDTKRYILEDNITTRAIGHYMNDEPHVHGDDAILDTMPATDIDILPNISWDGDIEMFDTAENNLPVIDWGEDINPGDINLMDEIPPPTTDEINWEDYINIFL